MYTKQKQAKFETIRYTLAIVAIIAVVLLLLPRPSTSDSKVTNILIQKQYDHYTIEYYNGKMNKLYIDTTVYNVYSIIKSDCDSMRNEEHNCELWDSIKVWRVINKLGIK